MVRGVTEKGIRMTQNRKNILKLLIEEGGALRSKEGRATSLMHGLLEHKGSLVSLNATLRELETLGFIEREVTGRRTYAISITQGAMDELGVEAPPAQPVAPEQNGSASNGSVPVTVPATSESSNDAAPITEAQWAWNDQPAALPDGIDYDILLAVFLKAALRGMESPSLSGELNHHKSQNEILTTRVAELENEVHKFRTEAASLVAERDQLQKNLNIIMSKAQAKTTRGSDPIRKLLSESEISALDSLMRQIPSRQGE